MGLGVIEWATALLYNGRGRHAEALAAAQRGCEHDDVGLFAWSLVELIEAGVRSGATDAALRRARSPERAHASERHRLGARHRGRLPRAAERRTSRGAPLSRGGRAARTQPRRGPPRPRPAPLRRMAAPRAAPRRRARAAAGARDVQPHGREAFAERARGELLATGETVRKRRVDARRAHRAGGADRPPGARRAHEPRDRRAAVHQPAHRRVAPAPGLHQARHPLAP